MIEQLQRRATRFILNDYKSDYQNHLLRLNLLRVPIMYIFELTDIMFAIKLFKALSSSFDITKYLSFTAGSTRSAAQGKLKHISVPNNKARHSYFNRLPHLWNALPPIDLSLPASQNRAIIYKFLQSHFISNFRPDNPCSYHVMCPCCKCTGILHPPTLKYSLSKLNLTKHLIRLRLASWSQFPAAEKLIIIIIILQIVQGGKVLRIDRLPRNFPSEIACAIGFSHTKLLSNHECFQVNYSLVNCKTFLP